MVALAIASTAFADTTPAAPVIRLTLKDYRFTPDVITIPANQRVKIELTNEDATGDDIESKDLHVDKEVAALGHVTFFIGPLTPGTYAFKAEKSAATAHGTVVVTATGQ
jgi:hypothetical protein